MITYALFKMHTHVWHPRLSPITDSPLCSPKNTSLNFLRGFPKSPPADMVANKKRSLYMYVFKYLFSFSFFFFLLSACVFLCAVGAQRILLSSQNGGNAAQHRPVSLGSVCACATPSIKSLTFPFVYRNDFPSSRWEHNKTGMMEVKHYG